MPVLHALHTWATSREGASTAHEVLEGSHGHRSLHIPPAPLHLKAQHGMGQGASHKLPAALQALYELEQRCSLSLPAAHACHRPLHILQSPFISKCSMPWVKGPATNCPSHYMLCMSQLELMYCQERKYQLDYSISAWYNHIHL